MRNVYEHFSLAHMAWLLAQALVLFVGATFVFDVIHFTLHQLLNSRRRMFQALGRPHWDHHEFYDRNLCFHEEVTGRNIRYHVLPEFVTQMVVCALGLLVFDAAAVVMVMGFFAIALVGVLVMKGKDHHHIAYEILPAAHEGFWVRSAYHSLHHVYPGSYLGSYTTLLDRVIGTGCQVRGRTVAITGASGAFGSALTRRLERAGATVVPLKHGRDYAAGDLSGVDEALRRSDILALCHGSKGDDAMWANCDSFLALIERFKMISAARRIPPEVWAVGSEIECHPAFGDPELLRYARSKRAFARQAARFFYDGDVLYRHIVPSAFRSGMGPGLISADAAAGLTLALVRRGFRYVPVTYTGVALVNALPFFWRAARAGVAPVARRPIASTAQGVATAKP